MFCLRPLREQSTVETHLLVCPLTVPKSFGNCFGRGVDRRSCGLACHVPKGHQLGLPWVIGIGRNLPIVASGRLIFARCWCNRWSNISSRLDSALQFIGESRLIVGLWFRMSRVRVPSSTPIKNPGFPCENQGFFVIWREQSFGVCG